MASGTIQAGGLASGMNTDRMVQKMVQSEARRLETLQQDKSEAQETRKLYRQLNNQLKGVLDAARGLNDASLFQARSVTSSDSQVATAEADKNAELNSYRLEPKQLARSQTLLVGPGDGKADGQFGRPLGDPDSAGPIGDGVQVTFHHQGQRFAYRTDSDTTLSQLARTIAEDDNGVRGSAVNVGTPDRPQYVLQLSSEATGTGDRRITKDAEGRNPGLSVTGGNLFTASGRLGDEVQQAQPGRNARFALDGVEYSRPTNAVDDAIPGVTFTLQQGEGQTQIEVARNTDKAAKAVKGLVDAYNSLQQFIQKQTAFNAQSNQGGPLMGDSLPRTIGSRLSGLIGGQGPQEGGSQGTLFEAGIHFRRDGQLQFNQSELMAALEQDPAEVRKLFAGEQGLAARMEEALEGFTRAGNGQVPSKIDSLSRQSQNLDGEIQDERARLKQFEERQRERFAELERTMSGFESKKQQMAQAMSRLPGA